MAVRLSMKKKKLLMFRDGKRAKAFRRGIGILSFFFRLSLAVTVVSALLFVAAILLWYAMWVILAIVTLGLILLSENKPDIGPFLSGLLPVIVVSLCATAALFVLRFVCEWIMILAEAHALKKDPQGNAHHIAIARVVKKVKIADIIVFAAMVLSVALMVMLSNAANIDAETIAIGQKVLLAICLLVFIGFPIAGRLYAKRQFAEIDADIAAVLSAEKAARPQTASPWDNARI